MTRRPQKKTARPKVRVWTRDRTSKTQLPRMPISELASGRAIGKGRNRLIHRRLCKSKEFPLDAPYTLAYWWRLEEGGNLLGVVTGVQATPKHGSKVSVKFEDAPGGTAKWPRIFFDLV